jgi:hypothetical protein
VYPLGTQFPLQLAEVQPDSAIPLVTPNGWNIGQRYGWSQVVHPTSGKDSLHHLLQTFAHDRMAGLPPLPANKDAKSGDWSEWSETDLASWIGAIADNPNVAYWDLPEELRFWKPTEFQIVRDYSAWTRQYDPRHRPNLTASFTPNGDTSPVQFPSIGFWCKQWHGKTFLIAVNSTDQTVNTLIANLPVPSATANVPFERRTVLISGSGFSDSFPAWGVHIYVL